MLTIFIISVLYTCYYSMDRVEATEKYKGKIDAVEANYVKQTVYNGVDNIRFKLKRYEDAEELKRAKEKALAEKRKREKWKKIRAMSLSELEDNGYIDKLCEKHNMSKKWFDRISTTESGYGNHVPKGSFNAWGWGIYGNKVTKLGTNWYDSSDYFIASFVENYGSSPTKSDMKRYCPGGAYNKYF